MNKNILIFILFCMCAMGVTSCKDEEKQQKEAPFLDINIHFDGPIKPVEGNLLTVDLYYSDVTGKSHQTLVSDSKIQKVLSDTDISQGLRISFEDINRSTGIVQVSAYIDTDDNGEIDDMDLATFYKEIIMKDVENGDKTPANVVQDYAITFNVNRFVGEVDSEEEEEEEEEGIVKDFDGNTYETVAIGNQVWMKENLRTVRYNNGAPITNGSTWSNDDWTAITASNPIAVYVTYPHADVDWIGSEEEMIQTYGLLYNWHAVNTGQLCPRGWRVPTDDDWKELESYIGIPQDQIDASGWRGDLAGKLKATEGWTYVNPDGFNGTDDYGFSMIPAGARVAAGTLTSIGNLAYFWSSTEASANNGYRRVVRNTAAYEIQRGGISKREAYCVRCIKIQ